MIAREGGVESIVVSGMYEEDGIEYMYMCIYVCVYRIYK